MISLEKTGNAIKFTFDDNGHYLQDGTIEVPVNSLTLVTDDSEMFTFKKSATNDIFVSGLYSEIGMSKSELETFYKDNMVGSTGGGSGSGITSGEVQTMIDESISGKVDTSTFNTYSGTVDTAINSKASQSTVNALNDVVTAHTANTEIHVTATEKNTWNNKSDFSGNYNDLSNKPTIPTVSSAITSGDTNAVAGGAVYDKFDEVEEVTARALNGLYDSLSGKVETSAFTAYSATVETALSGKQTTLVSGTNIKTINNESLLGSGNIDIQGGSSYTAGRGIDITNDTISFSLPISAGTGTGSIIANGNSTKATGNQSFAEGYSTSATSQGAHSEGMYTKATGTAAHAEGSNTAAVGDYSFAGGRYSNANTTYSFAHGRYINANNEAEHSIGKFNVSNTGSTDADKTLFSVGNGTADNARHNAFEIRQNGDIYITSGGTDIKLQDNLGGGGGGSSYSAGTGIDITNDVISVKEVSGNTTWVDLTSSIPTETSMTFNASSVIVTLYEGSFTLNVSIYDNNGRFLSIENNGSGLDVAGNTPYFDYITSGFTITASPLSSSDKFISLVNENGNNLDNVVEYFSAYTNSSLTLQEFADDVYTQLGGLKLVKLTQAEYDVLVSKDNNTLYVIVN